MKKIIYMVLITWGCNLTTKETTNINEKNNSYNIHKDLLIYAYAFNPQSPNFDKSTDCHLDSIMNNIHEVTKYSDAHIAILLLLEKQYYFQLCNFDKFEYEGRNLMEVKGKGGAAKIVDLFITIVEFQTFDEYFAIDEVFDFVETDEKLRENVDLKGTHQMIKLKRANSDKNK